MNCTHKFLLSAVFLIVVSCKKDGTGGDAGISARVQHHEKAIPGATVYIKYGATEFPGAAPGNYDEHKVCDANAKTQFSNLLPGHYYFYGVGFDSSIQEAVTGGIPLEIKRKQKKSNIDLLVPVTE
jgi:hypothetical protein